MHKKEIRGKDMDFNDIYNPRPSIIPGVQYPTTDREERLLTGAYHKGYADAKRQYKEPDTLLNYMRKEVERIRREEVLS